MRYRWLLAGVCASLAGISVVWSRVQTPRARSLPNDDYAWLSRAFVDSRPDARLLVVALDEPRAPEEALATLRHYLLRPQRADLALLNPVPRARSRARNTADRLAKHTWRVDDVCNATSWPATLREYDAALFTRTGYFHRCHHPDLRNLDPAFAWITEPHHFFTDTRLFVGHLAASLCGEPRPGPFKPLPAPIFEAEARNGTLAPLRREQVLAAIARCGY